MDQTPELPPHLQKNRSFPSRNTDVNKSFGPSLPASISKLAHSEECDDTLSDESIDDYCPELPPHLQSQSSSGDDKKNSDSTNYNSNTQSSSDNSKDNVNDYTPELPPHLKNKLNNSSASDNEDDPFCPTLPPHLVNKTERTYGPERPPANTSLQNNEEYSIESDQRNSSDDEDQDVGGYGPMPAPQPVDMDEHITKIFQERSKKLKEEQERQSAPKKLERESWMLELPEDRPLVGLGLQARKFSRNGKTKRGDTSAWTDTPADKERKAKSKDKAVKEESSEDVIEEKAISDRDKKLQEFVDEYNNKRRADPLVDIHKITKKNKTDDDLSLTGIGLHRKPFSREDDLHVNKFDEAQKTTILKKAKQLNDRFSSGKSKFL